MGIGLPYNGKKHAGFTSIYDAFHIKLATVTTAKNESVRVEWSASAPSFLQRGLIAFIITSAEVVLKLLDDYFTSRCVS